MCNPLYDCHDVAECYHPEEYKQHFMTIAVKCEYHALRPVVTHSI